VAAFQGLRAEWSVVLAQEIALHEELSNAKAQVDIADAALDDFAQRFSNALLAIVGKKSEALYLHFFKIPLNELRKPVLGQQLQKMADWIVSLNTTPHPTLAAMKPELVALVDAGTKAAKNRDTIVLQIQHFREVGERKQLFTKTNAERKHTHGALVKLALSTPGLPANFADQFFKPGEVDDAPEETIDSVDAEIKALQERLAERTQRLDELKKEAAEAEQDGAVKAQKATKLAELNKDIEAKQKEAQALKAELE
jgi:hypothetical protein